MYLFIRLNLFDGSLFQIMGISIENRSFSGGGYLRISKKKG